jgi:hypothetical protein
MALGDEEGAAAQESTPSATSGASDRPVLAIDGGNGGPGGSTGGEPPGPKPPWPDTLRD